MIFYATRKTFERYNIKTPEEVQTEIDFSEKKAGRKKATRLYEWGCKIFYFDRRKCLQLVHFDTKFTVFLIDIKVADVDSVTTALRHAIFDIYADDEKMIAALEQYFESSPSSCYKKLKDRSVIATLNRTQRDFAADGYRFYDYFEAGRPNVDAANLDINREAFTRKNKGKTERFYPIDLFKKSIKKKFR